MRSRYSAFFLSLPKYIIKTTHKDNVDYTQDITQWENDIVYFTQNFNFEKLTIIDHIPGNTISFVTFKAQISSHGKDETFCEKSKFERINNRWLYLSGEQIIKA